MRIAGHQPNYLPYLGFFHKAARVDQFVIVDHVQFVKRGPFGWIHRNKVRTAEGWTWLTVPVRTRGRFTQQIREVEIDNARGWARKHRTTLERCYRRAPHFERYAERILPLYDREWEGLSALNTALIRALLACFGIDVPVLLSSELGISSGSTQLIIDMCRALGADTYLSGVHGQDYLDVPAVEAAGLALEFQAFEHPEYAQVYPGPFQPGMCALDLLFNCGPESNDILIGTAG